MNDIIKEVNHAQKLYNNLKSAGELSGSMSARLMAALTNYDRRLRSLADLFGLYIAKGEDVRFAMAKQFS